MTEEEALQAIKDKAWCVWKGLPATNLCCIQRLVLPRYGCTSDIRVLDPRGRVHDVQMKDLRLATANELLSK